MKDAAMKEKLPLIVALIFGIIAFVGINQYLASQKVTPRTTTILVAAKSLERGATLRIDDVRTKSVPAELFAGLDGYFGADDSGRLAGQVLSRDIRAGEPIAASHLLLEGGLDSPRIDRFSMKLQPGTRAISLPLDSVGSVSDFLRVNDRVDVLANISIPKVRQRTFTVPNEGLQTIDEITYEGTTIFLFENVPVLAVGDVYEELTADEASMGGGSITMAVTPREAQVLAWALRNGGNDQQGGDVTFTLLLRSPEDDGLLAQRELVTFENLLDMTQMDELQEMRLQLQPSKPEIYRGGVPSTRPPVN
jgi:pilus assembly protein CpaB